MQEANAIRPFTNVIHEMTLLLTGPASSGVRGDKQSEGFPQTGCLVTT